MAKILSRGGLFSNVADVVPMDPYPMGEQVQPQSTTFTYFDFSQSESTITSLTEMPTAVAKRLYPKTAYSVLPLIHTLLDLKTEIRSYRRLFCENEAARDAIISSFGWFRDDPRYRRNEVAHGLYYAGH
ncbi:hypothetical protein CPB84DRAFT_1753672, partial [Gymnopilus junonius]